MEIQNNSGGINENLIQIEIEAAAEKMFEKLSRSIREIAKKAYKKFYDQLTETWSDVLGNTSNSNVDELIENELYDTINIWLNNLKKWLFDGINSTLDDSSLETKSYIQKGLFGDAFFNIIEFLSKTKDKINTMIRNVVNSAETTAQKIAFKVKRVEKYEIILSGHPKTCEKCKEMSSKKFNIADLSVGETAPPFHPNCGCTMIPYVSEEKDGSLREQAFIGFNVAFEFLSMLQPWMIPLYQKYKSLICTAGILYLESQNCPLAKEMFSLGMYGGGKGMSEKATSLMVQAMQNSKQLNDKIFELTKLGRDFDTGDDEFEFKKDSDKDLYYAVQNVNMRITGAHLGDNFWNIKVRVWDKYDFTTFRNSLAFADLANNLGEAMQRNGMMTEYDTLTEYNYVWRGRWS